MKNCKYNRYPCNGCSKEHLCGNGDSCGKFDNYYIEREKNFMDKNQVYEIAFKTIKESTEWGIGDESKVYGNWIDGVVTMANNLLNKIDEQNNKPVEN